MLRASVAGFESAKTLDSGAGELEGMASGDGEHRQG